MEERIPEIVKKEFNACVLEIKRITEGYSHYMYDVKIDKFPGEVIIRFANSTRDTVSLAKEKYVIENLTKHGLPVPKIFAFYYPEEKKEDGYMILEKFEDIRLDTIWDDLSKEEKIKMTVKMGELLKKIHTITFGELDI